MMGRAALLTLTVMSETERLLALADGLSCAVAAALPPTVLGSSIGVWFTVVCVEASMLRSARREKVETSASHCVRECVNVRVCLCCVCACFQVRFRGPTERGLRVRGAECWLWL